MAFGPKRIVKNASWIISCKIIQAVLNLIVTMFTARYLGPSNYGVISYAASLVAFMVPVMELGLRNTLVQEFVNDPQKEGEILGTSLCLNVISAIFCIISVSAFAAITNIGDTETIVICALYSTSLIFQALEMTQHWYQYKLISKYSSITMLFAYVVTSVYKLYILITGKSIYWFAVSQSIDFLIIAVILFVIYHRKSNNKLTFSRQRAKILFSASRYYIISNLMVTVFAHTDKIMLKYMLGEEATGFYAAAVVCANMTGFVSQAIIGSARPVIFENKKHNEQKFQNSMKVLYAVIIYFSLLQSLGITALAPIIIKIIYGAEYVASVPALMIIVWYTTFSYLGSVRNIWILAESKQSVLWKINLSGALGNVILNFMFIPIWGICGAAFASLLTQIFTNVIIGFIIKPIRKNNYLMVSSLNVLKIVKDNKEN